MCMFPTLCVQIPKFSRDCGFLRDCTPPHVYILVLIHASVTGYNAGYPPRLWLANEYSSTQPGIIALSYRAHVCHYRSQTFPLEPSSLSLYQCTALSDSRFHISLRGYSAFTECVQNKAYILVVKTFKKNSFRAIRWIPGSPRLIAD